jgi:TRAP-type C4-dicarboxylate transport system permease small subunit
MRAALTWLDRNLEKTVILAAYATCAGIVAVEVFRRYFFAVQAPWSTSVPAYMFLWLTWIGAAHGVKIRAHLSFSELRAALPKRAQFALMQLDNLLLLIFATIVIYYASDLLKLQWDNGSIVPGTDTIPQWWFYLATPVGWSLLCVRVIQNVVEDFANMRAGAAMKVRGEMSVE